MAMQAGRRKTVHNSPADTDLMSPPVQGRIFSSPAPPLISRKSSSEGMGDPGATVPMVGLLNIGNTDYLNAALQAILHMRPLTKYLLTSDVEQIINTEGSRELAGEMVRAYAHLLKGISKFQRPFAPNQFHHKLGRIHSEFDNND